MRGKRSKQYRKLMQVKSPSLNLFTASNLKGNCSVFVLQTCSYVPRSSFGEHLTDPSTIQAYSLTFGFRPPYQVLGIWSNITCLAIIQLSYCRIVDAEMIRDTERFRMDLVGGLERSLGEKVKPSAYTLEIFYLISLTTNPTIVITQ